MNLTFPPSLKKVNALLTAVNEWSLATFARLSHTHTQQDLTDASTSVIGITKEEYCADLSKGVLLTNPACAWVEKFTGTVVYNSIILDQPYTNFRFLRVDYTGKDVNLIGSNIIDVSLFHKLMTDTHLDRGVGTDGTFVKSYACAVYNLCGDALDPSWLIWTSNSCVTDFNATKSTTTKFTYYSNTGLILGIWGFN